MPRMRRGHGEGSIYQQTDGRWTAAITLENRKRKVFYGKTRKEVQEKLKQALHEQQQGTLITAPQQTVGQFLVDWLENTHKKSVRPRTYERYQEAIRLHLVPVLGGYQLLKLSAQHVQAFYTKKLNEGLSPTTVIYFHSVLHNALDTAVKWGLVSRNVCDLTSPLVRNALKYNPLQQNRYSNFL